MTRKHRFALPLLVFTTIVGVVPAGGSEPALQGVYISRGGGPEGVEHHGVVSIEPHGDGFLVLWMAAGAEGETVVLVPAATGIGLADGGVLAVSYFTPNGSGVVLYRIEDEGRRLAGRWIVAGGNGTAYPEILTKIPGDVPVSPPSSPPDQPTPTKPRTPPRSSGGKVM